MRGNVIDMAVGVIIGAAFGKIVTSVVNDILMPLIGLVVGGIDFTGLSIMVGDAKITYGNFIQNVIDFLIVAFCIFLFVKGINSLTKKKKDDTPAAPPAPSKEEQLLTDIRDILRNK